MQRTSNKYSPSPFSRYYENNATLQLIMGLGAAFVIFHFVIAVMRVMHFSEAEILNTVVAYTTLPSLSEFNWRVWEVFTYGLFHMKQTAFVEIGFWSMFSNMIWLYCFGSVVQVMIGYRHVIPMFFYCVIAGGIFYLAAQVVPAWSVPANVYIGGAQAGVVGLAVASVSIAPKYRFYLAPHFSIPIIVVVAIFGVLMMLNVGFRPAPLMLIAGGGLVGFIYITFLRKGYNPGEWIYGIFKKVGSSVTPKEDAYRKYNQRRNEVLNSGRHSSRTIDEQRVDDILDKINRKGYNSLTKEEKEILLRASKENE